MNKLIITAQNILTKSKELTSATSKIALNNWPYIIIVLLAAILTLPNFSKFGIPYGSGANDTAFHMVRMAGSAMRGFKDGQLVPQVDPAATSGMGLGTNLFYGPMLTYVLPVLRAITFSWDNAYIVLIFIALLLAGVFMFKFSFALFKNKYIACIASSIYLTTPYYLSDVYIRGSWGEIPSFVFMPMLFLGIYNALHNKKYAITLMWLAASGIVLNHMLSIIIVFPFALLFFLMNHKKIDITVIKKVSTAALITIGLTAFFWLPLVEIKTTGLYNIFNTPYLGQIPANGATEVTNNGLSIVQYLFTDPLNGTNGVTQYYISFFALAGLIACLFAYKKSNKNIQSNLSIISIITLIAVLLSLSSPFWMYVPKFMLNIQFPWRFCMITTFGISLLSSYGLFYAISKFTTQSNYKLATSVVAFILVVITLPLLSSIYYAYPHTTFADLYKTNKSARGYFSKSALYEYFPVVPCDSTRNSNTCSWKILQREDIRKPQVTVGKADLKNVKSNGTAMSFDINVKSNNALVRLPRIYYPGYSATVSDPKGSEKADIGYSKNYGLVQINVKPGNHHVKIKYYNTIYTNIGLTITVITAISITVFAAVTSLRQSKRHI